MTSTDGVLARLRAAWTPPSIRLQRILALLLLLGQGGITVTGSLVRVTGSGLGCDTWPLCHEGSLVPVAGAAPWIHQAIEFGNRLLAIVLSAAAVAVLVAVVRAKRRSEIIWLAGASLAGIGVQAVIGGMSVLMNLHWWTVALHFLPSMILVWIAALLYMRIAETDDAQPQRRFSSIARTFTIVAAVALSLVLITGTMVTGSGPHSGDAGVGMEGRLDLDTRMLAYVHAAAMYVYLFTTLVTVYLLRRDHAPKDAFRTALVLVGALLVQWAIGVTQFYLGVPRWTVPMHIAMSSVVVAFCAFLYAHGRRRMPTLV
ncbi:COX15/CtaA family protein [Corynebacterium timonense]|uniref:COX15/CtaA family protein n=1 Tax=Corynebacterium timonense TaxID=441500 RepID=UPI0006851B72|nr:COX15/CtaA family protein [Corynebacterium timonense]